MIKIYNSKRQVVLRFEIADLNFIDKKAKAAGMSRQRFMTELVLGVLNLDCRPSEYTPFEKAFKKE